MPKKKAKPKASELFPNLPASLASCGPYYERTRLHLRRFLSYLKPWEAGKGGSAAGSEASSDDEEGAAAIDNHVVRLLIEDDYSEERTTSLEWLSESLVGQPEAVEEPDWSGTPGERFEALRAALELTTVEVDLLWVLLLPELVPEFMWLYRTIWTDSSQVACQDDFLVHVLDPFGGEQAAVRAALAPLSLLRRLLLIEEVSVPGRRGERYFRAGSRLVEHLLGVETMDPELAGRCRSRAVTVPLSECSVDKDVAKRVVKLLAKAAQEGSWRPSAEEEDRLPLVVHLFGPEGAGRRSACAALAAEARRGIVDLAVGTLEGEEGVGPWLLRRARRAAFLRRSLLLLSEADVLDDEEKGRGLRGAVRLLLADQAEPVFVASHKRLRVLDDLPVLVVAIELRAPPSADRQRLWKDALKETGWKLDSSVKTRDLARKYNLTPGKIRNAVQEAMTRATLEGRAGKLNHKTIIAATTAQLSHDLSSVADRVEKTLDWKDLILPSDCIETLKEVVRRYRHQGQVFDNWGFRAKFAYGVGISALFSGPPGTGKTMAAGILARELDMELFRIDLSRVVSKWIGETEKNLSRVFDEAKASHAIILFDEADSLFGRRGEVKSSVDRYSNLEVNYLLQRMESFEGISLLTTNQPQSMDEAFARRITFKVPFPFPEEKTRLRLWKSMIPPEAEVARNVDFRLLADKFEFSGGHIKQAVLRAAFLAAESKRPISQRQLILACLDEARGMGRLLRDEDLLEWLEEEEEERPKRKKRSTSRRRSRR